MSEQRVFLPTTTMKSRLTPSLGLAISVSKKLTTYHIGHVDATDEYDDGPI